MASSLNQGSRRNWLKKKAFPLPDGGNPEEPITLLIRRDHILEDSYGEVMSLGRDELSQYIQVEFVGEEGHGRGVLKVRTTHTDGWCHHDCWFPYPMPFHAILHVV